MNGDDRPELRSIWDEAKVLIEQCRREYNQVRPNITRGYRPPAPEAILTMVTT